MRRIILTLSDPPEPIAIRINVEGIGCYHISELYPNQTFLFEGGLPHYVKETPEEIDALIDAACKPDPHQFVWSGYGEKPMDHVRTLEPTAIRFPLTDGVDTTSGPLQEGTVKKGGQNPKPTTDRPVPPQGQSGPSPEPASEDPGAR